MKLYHKSDSFLIEFSIQGYSRDWWQNFETSFNSLSASLAILEPYTADKEQV